MRKLLMTIAIFGILTSFSFAGSEKIDIEEFKYRVKTNTLTGEYLFNKDLDWRSEGGETLLFFIGDDARNAAIFCSVYLETGGKEAFAEYVRKGLGKGSLNAVEFHIAHTRPHIAVVIALSAGWSEQQIYGLISREEEARNMKKMDFNTYSLQSPNYKVAEIKEFVDTVKVNFNKFIRDTTAVRNDNWMERRSVYMKAPLSSSDHN